MYKVFEISRQEGPNGFQVVEHNMAIFAEEYAVDNIVEGEIEESVCKMTVVLFEKDSLGWKKAKDRWSNHIRTLFGDNMAHVQGRVWPAHLTVEALPV